MIRYIFGLCAIALIAFTLTIADGFAATKKKSSTVDRKSAWAHCTKVCKKAYGPPSSVHHVQWFSGKPFCWCR